jgi:uncharacterized damage-inducible protein DinB
MVRVEHVLDTWKVIRQDTAAAVEEFPAGEFGFRPAADIMTFGEISHHILNAGHGLTGLLLTGEENFTGPDFRDRVSRHFTGIPATVSPAELASALREKLEARASELIGKSPEFYGQLVTRMDGIQVTRLEMVQAIKEHELTHRAQLFTYMRLKGMVPPTTRRRLAKQAGK